jgi:Holliday junction DNA helicase RuvA
MIARLAGTVVAREGDRIVVETGGGVGYEVAVPRSVLERLPAVGGRVELATLLVVRDDGWALFGFSGEGDRRIFQRLLGVSGVGPRLAMALVSALGLPRLARALRDRDLAVLTSVPGVGRRTAERLAVELADKLEDVDSATDGAPVSSETEAALQALVRLGYGPSQADTALRGVVADDGGADSATLIRRALQRLTRT